MIYSQDLPVDYTVEVYELTKAHVRDHLASVADPHDDPASLASEVRLRAQDLPDGGLRVLGELAAEPQAPYLQPGYDPDRAAAMGL